MGLEKKCYERQVGKAFATRKASQEELDDMYVEFDAFNASSISRRQPTPTDSLYSDEISIPLTPTTARLGTRGSRPGTRLGTCRPLTAHQCTTRVGTVRPITAKIGDQSVGLNRPLTAIRGAGYSQSTAKSHPFDPLNMRSSSSGISVLKIEAEETPISRIRKLENRIWELVDESGIANCDKKLKKALELAKDAELKEKVLQKQEEEANAAQQHNWDLTFLVFFNLAIQYESNELYGDALRYYSAVSTEKFLVHAPKVRLNMGNIFVKQCQYSKAIKIYRLGLDRLGTGENKRMRVKLLQNLGVVFLQIKNYADAATSFETIMVERPNFIAAFHLVIANYMRKDTYATKTSFQELLQIPLPPEDETLLQIKDDPNSTALYDVFSNDSLSKYSEKKREFAEKCVLTAGRLIAPIVEMDLAEGYNWVIRQITESQHSTFAAALEISKAVHLIKQGDINQAKEILHNFERKETKFLPSAATNLSFIYYLQGDYLQALKYGELGVAGDCYNEKSFVNLANSLTALGQLERARTLYYEGFRLNSTSIESIYNLGLIDQSLRNYEAALVSFKKILNLLPNFGDVLYQIGYTFELMDDSAKANEYYLKALAICPQDAGILKKLGVHADRLGDKHQAYSYFSDAIKCNPSDVSVMKWLGSYLMDSHLSEQAIEYFRSGLTLEPTNSIWLLSIANCQKQLGNIGLAIQHYKATLETYPNNLEALEGLISLAKCLDRQEVNWYKQKLNRLRQSTVPEVANVFTWDFDLKPRNQTTLTQSVVSNSQKFQSTPKIPGFCGRSDSHGDIDFRIDCQSGDWENSESTLLNKNHRINETEQY